MSVQISYKKQFTIGLVLILIFFIILEISIRPYDYYFPNCQLMRSDAFSDIEINLQREICYSLNHLKTFDDPPRYQPNQHFSDVIHINSDGFRGPELKNDEETYRIFFVGGSTAIGSGSTSDLTTIPGHLQSFFDKQNNTFTVEVVNAGISGSNSFVESNYVKNKIINFNPDLIIVYDGWNDIMLNYDFYYSGRLINTPLHSMFEFAMNNEYVKLLEIIVRNYTIWRHDTTDRDFDGSFIDEKIHSWKKTWDGICEYGKQNNFDVIITLQPVLGSSNKELSNFEKISFKKYDLEDLLSYYDKYANELSNFNSCKNTMDLRNVFDDVKRPLFFDGVHINDYGNKLVAKKIFDETKNFIQQKNL